MIFRFPNSKTTFVEAVLLHYPLATLVRAGLTVGEHLLQYGENAPQRG
jgi:hypothetical protein